MTNNKNEKLSTNTGISPGDSTDEDTIVEIAVKNLDGKSRKVKHTSDSARQRGSHIKPIDSTPLMEISNSTEVSENISKKAGINGEAYFTEDGKEKIEYLENLVSKQLELYNWCETKVSTLATIDSILLGAAALFVDKVKVVSETPNVWTYLINSAMIIVLLVPIFISLAITLWHIRPKMSSGKANAARPNHRSSSGIHKFKDKDAYRAHLAKLSAAEICEDLSNQAFGMNHNIWKHQQSIKKAVLFDLIGLVGFLLIIFYLVVFS